MIAALRSHTRTLCLRCEGALLGGAVPRRTAVQLIVGRSTGLPKTSGNTTSGWGRGPDLLFDSGYAPNERKLNVTQLQAFPRSPQLEVRGSAPRLRDVKRAPWLPLSPGLHGLLLDTTKRLVERQRRWPMAAGHAAHSPVWQRDETDTSQPCLTTEE